MGDAPVADSDGWISRRSDPGGRSRNPPSKRAYEGQGAGEASPVCTTARAPAVTVGERRRARPVARYRRSMAEVGGASESGELDVGGSYERPIDLLSPEAGPRVRVQSRNPSAEVINLEDDSPRSARWVAPTLNVQAGTSSSSRRTELGEPSSKRVRNVAEDRAPVRPAEAPVVVPGSVRPSRSSGSRNAVLRVRRQQAARTGELNPLELAAAAQAEHVQPTQINNDERYARRLQEFAAEGFDAQLARSLQELDRRLVRTPSGVAIDPARFQMFYMRHLERVRSTHGHGRGPQPSGSDMFRQFGRRYRAGVADIQERINVLGALLQGQLPLAMQLAYVDRDFNENDYEMLLALDDSVKQVGAPQSRIDELPVTEATSETDECCICLEKAEVGDKIRRLPCLHGFHQQCIDLWLQRRANCPVCKADI